MRIMHTSSKIVSDRQRETREEVKNPLSYSMAVELVCEICDQEDCPPMRRESYHIDFNLDLPQDRGKIDLVNLFRDNMKHEIIRDYICIKCSLRNYLSKFTDEYDKLKNRRLPIWRRETLPRDEIERKEFEASLNWIC